MEIIEEGANKGDNDREDKGTESALMRLDPDVEIMRPMDRKIPVHLTLGKTAYLVYPSDINEKDIKIMEYEVGGILLRLKMEEELREEAEKEKAAQGG